MPYDRSSGDCRCGFWDRETRACRADAGRGWVGVEVRGQNVGKVLAGVRDGRDVDGISGPGLHGQLGIDTFREVGALVVRDGSWGDASRINRSSWYIQVGTAKGRGGRAMSQQCSKHIVMVTGCLLLKGPGSLVRRVILTGE